MMPVDWRKRMSIITGTTKRTMTAYSRLRRNAAALAAELPDEALVYVPGYGELRLGELRAPRKVTSIVDDATRRMIEERVTRHLDPLPPCRPGATRSERKASTA